MIFFTETRRKSASYMQDSIAKRKKWGKKMDGNLRHQGGEMVRCLMDFKFKFFLEYFPNLQSNLANVKACLCVQCHGQFINRSRNWTLIIDYTFLSISWAKIKFWCVCVPCQAQEWRKKLLFTGLFSKWLVNKRLQYLFLWYFW